MATAPLGAPLPIGMRRLVAVFGLVPNDNEKRLISPRHEAHLDVNFYA
jgi:hypothetical protein